MPYLETISALALSTSMPQALAVILNCGPFHGCLNALRALYPQHKGRVYVVEDPMGESTRKILERTTSLNIPCIVLADREPDPSVLPENSTPNLALISDRPYLPANKLLHSDTTAWWSWIGYQTYFCPASELDALSQTHANLLRLGDFRANNTLAEPLLRDANYHFVDMRAIRQCDAPDGLRPQPNGLYAEELCMLSRYIGMAQNLKAVFFYGYPANLEADAVSVEVTAECIWHLIEALAANTPEHPADPKTSGELQKKVVHLGENGQEIMFVHSLQTGRWWMEITSVSPNQESWFIPCSSDDYATACKAEVPMKWLKFYQLYNKL